MCGAWVEDGCSRDNEKFQYGAWLGSSKDELGTRNQRNVPKKSEDSTRDMSVSSSSAKKFDRCVKTFHGQSDTQGSRGPPENPSAVVPVPDPIPLVEKEAHPSSDVCGMDSGANLGLEAKIMGRQSLPKGQFFQIPEQENRKSPNQDCRGESGESVRQIFDRSLQTKETGQGVISALSHRGDSGKIQNNDLGNFNISSEGFGQSKEIVDVMKMEIPNGRESSTK
ncbi:hypothetical protein U1Q18_001266 [Sarracenia purpurea var. burkii]